MRWIRSQMLSWMWTSCTETTTRRKLRDCWEVLKSWIIQKRPVQTPRILFPPPQRTRFMRFTSEWTISTTSPRGTTWRNVLKSGIWIHAVFTKVYGDCGSMEIMYWLWGVQPLRIVFINQAACDLFIFLRHKQRTKIRETSRCFIHALNCSPRLVT